MDTNKDNMTEQAYIDICNDFKEQMKKKNQEIQFLKSKNEDFIKKINTLKENLLSIKLIIKMFKSMNDATMDVIDREINKTEDLVLDTMNDYTHYDDELMDFLEEINDFEIDD